jgi:hypothetical protein
VEHAFSPFVFLDVPEYSHAFVIWLDAAMASIGSHIETPTALLRLSLIVQF